MRNCIKTTSGCARHISHAFVITLIFTGLLGRSNKCQSLCTTECHLVWLHKTGEYNTKGKEELSKCTKLLIIMVVDKEVILKVMVHLELQRSEERRVGKECRP